MIAEHFALTFTSDVSLPAHNLLPSLRPLGSKIHNQMQENITKQRKTATNALALLQDRVCFHFWSSRTEGNVGWQVVNAREAAELRNSSGMGVRNSRELTRPNSSERGKQEAKIPSENKPRGDPVHSQPFVSSLG